MSADKRSVANVLVQPREQLMVILIFIAYAVVSLFGFALIFVFTMKSAIDRAATETDISPTALYSLQDSLQIATYSTIVFGLVLMITMVAAGFALSHRLFGPTVQLKRLISRLSQGEYSARGTLRKGDAFHDVMADLNGLSKELETKHGSKHVGS